MTKIFVTMVKGLEFCHLLCKRPGCYHSTNKTHVRDRIFKLSPIHASVQFNGSSAPLRTSSIVLRCHVLLNSVPELWVAPPNSHQILLKLVFSGTEPPSEIRLLTNWYFISLFAIPFFSGLHFYDLVYILVLGLRSWKKMKGRKSKRAKYTTHVMLWNQLLTKLG